MKGWLGKQTLGLFGQSRTWVDINAADTRIRHYGLLAGTAKAETIAKARHMLMASAIDPDTPEIHADITTAHAHPCPCCGGRMMIIELFEPGSQPRHQPITQTTQLALFERTKPQLGEGEVSGLEAHQRGAASPVRGFA